MKVSEEKTCSAVKMSSKWIMMMRDERKIVFSSSYWVFVTRLPTKTFKTFECCRRVNERLFKVKGNRVDFFLSLNVCKTFSTL
jgi:hypothetical protein